MYVHNYLFWAMHPIDRRNHTIHNTILSCYWMNENRIGLPF